MKAIIISSKFKQVEVLAIFDLLMAYEVAKFRIYR